MNTIRTLALVLLSILAVGCGASSASPTPAMPSDEPSVYEALFDRIGPSGETDAQLALDAFSLAISPIPGVAVPQGPAPEQYETVDGTFAIALVSQHWAELTPEQQTAVEHALTPGPNDDVFASDGTKGNPLLGTDGAVAARPTFALRAPLYAGLGPQPPAPHSAQAADDPTREHFLAVLREAEALIGQKVGRPIGKRWALWMKGGEPIGGPQTLAATVAPGLPLLGFPFPRWAPGCLFITFENTTQLQETELRASLAHEMWHCYQSSVAPADNFSPMWLIEGQAEWAGEALMGPSSVGTGWWRDYVVSPLNKLWDRTYDAGGFFWQLSEQGFDPFTHAKGMLEAIGHASKLGAAGARDDEFLYHWAAGLVRDPEVGRDFHTRAIWNIKDRMEPAEKNVSEGSRVEVFAFEVQNATFKVNATVEVVEVDIQGHALIGAPGSPSVRAGHVYLCVSGMCECPRGTHRVGPDFITMPSTFYMGVTGGLDGSQGTLIGHELKDFCQPDPSPVPDLPCSAGCGSSTGEPHLTTVDNVGYDFQATGEYVLLRSADGAFELQSRQVPLRDSLAVTINSALAMRVGEKRVAIYVAPDRVPVMEVRVDGGIVDATSPIDLGGGARIASYEGGVEVDFADGSQLWAVPTGHGCCINMLLAASDELKANGVGLLGDVAPGGAPLPALPDGTRLPRAADRHERFVQLYEQLGPAWMVTAETSLFDYEPGESPATFVVPGFPTESEYTTLEDLPPDVRAAGEAACADVTDEARLFECIFDVSLADFIEWAEGYVKLIELEEEGPVAIGAPPPLATQQPLPPPDELPQGFSRVGDGVAWIYQSLLSDDGRVYVAIRDAADTKSVMAVDATSGDVVAEVMLEPYGPMAFASNSLWVGAADGLDCVIKRLDPQTLAEIASIPITCDIFGSQFAALGDDIWYLDRTTADIDAKGGTLRRIDPATNQVGHGQTDAVTVPFTNGYLLSSDEAIFWRADAGDPAGDHQVYRLDLGATQLESLGQPENSSIYPDGRGVWTESQGDLGLEVSYRTNASAPDAVVPVDGVPVGADETSIYVAGSDFDGAPILLRYKTDGTAPDAVATSIALNTSQGLQSLDYVSDRPVMVTDHLVATLWLVPSPNDPNVNDLVLQATPLQ